MFSKLYLLIMLIGFAWLLFGGGTAYGDDARTAWGGLLIAGYALAMWLDSIRVLGIRHLRGVGLLARAFFLSKRGTVLTGIVVLALLYFWSPVARNPSPYRLEISIALVLVVVLLWTQPPCLLLLAESSPRTGQILSRLSAQLLPMRTVSLLDRTRVGGPSGGFSWLTDDLQTEWEHEWRELVEQLSGLVPNIILDARSDRPVIIWEAGQILKSPERRAKTLFLVEADGSALALEPHEEILRNMTISTITESMLEEAVDRMKRPRRKDD